MHMYNTSSPTFFVGFTSAIHCLIISEQAATMEEAEMPNISRSSAGGPGKSNILVSNIDMKLFQLVKMKYLYLILEHC